MRPGLTSLHKCSKCDLNFLSKEGMEKHSARVHEGTPTDSTRYKCDKCKSDFKSKADFKQHKLPAKTVGECAPCLKGGKGPKFLNICDYTAHRNGHIEEGKVKVTPAKPPKTNSKEENKSAKKGKTVVTGTEPSSQKSFSFKNGARVTIVQSTGGEQSPNIRTKRKGEESTESKQGLQVVSTNELQKRKSKRDMPILKNVSKEEKAPERNSEFLSFQREHEKRKRAYSTQHLSVEKKIKLESFADDSLVNAMKSKISSEVNPKVENIEDKFKCDLCPNSFKTNSTLMNHKNSHKKPYKLL